MKPIKLKLRGFITYKNEIEIDFTTLYDKKIFVISGDTGSGKTSIFDAISFALYGDVARSIPLDRLRCDFLSEEDLYTYVNLKFEVDNKFYEIERIPRQIAKKTKIGQNIAPSVILYDISKDKKIIAEKITETKDMINQIIGLDQNQFNKVMLLAQGEFQQFLNAKSDDRTKLLGDIFKTYEYKYIKDKIKEMARLAGNELQFIDNDLNSAVDRYEDIKNIVNKDDILVYEFKNIINNIDKEKKLLEDKLDSISSKEIKKQKEQQKEIAYRQNVKTTNDNIDRYNNIEEKLNDLNNKRNYYDELKSDYEKSNFAKSIKIYEDRLNEVNEQILQNEVLLTDYKAKKKEIEIDIEKLELLNKETPHKQKQLDIYKFKLNNNIKNLDDIDKYQDLEKQYKIMQKDISQMDILKKEIDFIKEKLFINREKLEILRDEFQTNKDMNLKLSDEIMKNQNNLDKINADIQKSNNNQKIKNKITNNEDNINKLLSDKLKLEDIRETYKSNIRLIEINKLIDELNKDGICPVCGDRHYNHYKKHDIKTIANLNIDDDLLLLNTKIAALTTENNVLIKSIEKIEDEDKLELNKENLENKLNEKYMIKKENNTIIDKISKDIKLMLAHNQKLSDDIDTKTKDLDTLINKSKLYEDIKIKYLSQKVNVNGLDRKEIIQTINELKKSITRLDKEIINLSNNLNKLYTNSTKIDSNIENVSSIVKKAKSNRDIFSKEFEEKIDEEFINIDDYRRYYNMYEEIIKSIEKVNQYFNELNKLTIMHSNLSEYKSLKKIDIEDIDSNIEKLTDELNELGSQKSNLMIKISNIDSTLQKIFEIKNRYKKIKEESEILSKLSKIAEGSFGKVKGREKVDFETFVLTYYFDKVLLYANMRLISMSNGQFSMMRRPVGDDGRVKSGLDIEILDSNTGKKRPASTLSGGESFLASLSLALGLSDEISAENGGIKIDTLFIDEGFGTLSEDYLNNVIEQIEKLSYEDKFIGLISHVDELKDAIDAKILVKYTNNEGSFIEVVK